MAVVSGGTTLIDNGTLDAGVPSGKLTLLSTQTASSSSSIDFTSGIDSTYDSYVFKFINIHGSTISADFTFQGSTNGGSSYGVTITSTAFRSDHTEDDSRALLEYRTPQDLAQSTSFQTFTLSTGNGNDENASGYLQLFNPSSTTFVKHWISQVNSYGDQSNSLCLFTAGYFNTTSAIDAIQFKMSSGNIDDGIIKMYGVG
jgi:hypothetical protein